MSGDKTYNSGGLYTYVDDLVNQIARDQGYTTHAYYVTQKFDKGDNYVGEINRVSIKGIKDNKGEEIKAIVKTCPPGISDSVMPITRYFACEDFAYNKYFPALNEFQNKSFHDDHKIRFAKCLASSLELKKEAFIFEDLNAVGFQMIDRMKSLDRDHVRLVIKTQATYHALAYAFKEKCTVEEYETYVNMSPIEEELNDGYFKYCKEISERLLEHIVDEDCRVKLKEFAESNIKDTMFGFMDVNKSMKEAPYNIIIHGDSWTSNFLFKYDEEKTVTDMVILDWQTIRLAPPICDLIYTLYLSLNEATREELWDELLDYYYDTLKSRLIDLNCDPEKCYPEAVFKQHLKTKMGFAFITVILMLPFTLVDKENTFDMNDFIENTENTETDFNTSIVKFSKECIDRINGAIRHLIKLNVI